MKKRNLPVLLALTMLCGASAVYCAEKTEKKGPLTAEEIAKKLASETPKQKALRAELKKVGGKVYFDGGQVYTVGFDGAPAKREFEIEGGASYPHVSPDGKRLIVMQWRSKLKPESFVVKKLDERYPVKNRKMDHRVIIMMNIDGTARKPLCYGWDAHWSKTGKALVYNLNMKGRRNRPIAVLDLTTMTEHVVSPKDWSRYHSAGFACTTPDGKWVISGNPRFVAIPLNEQGTGMLEGGKVVSLVHGRGDTGCNEEVSPDGKWLAWTIDTYGESGGWLYYAPFSTKKPQRPSRMNLGWKPQSVNYDPDFSPDSKYLVYMHGEMVRGKKSYSGAIRSEIYAARFPPDGVSVRLTFLNGHARHPQWVPDGARKAPVKAAAKAE